MPLKAARLGGNGAAALGMKGGVDVGTGVGAGAGTGGAAAASLPLLRTKTPMRTFSSLSGGS